MMKHHLEGHIHAGHTIMDDLWRATRIRAPIIMEFEGVKGMKTRIVWPDGMTYSLNKARTPEPLPKRMIRLKRP